MEEAVDLDFLLSPGYEQKHEAVRITYLPGAQQISSIRDSYWERGAMEACTLHMMELSNQTVKYVKHLQEQEIGHGTN